MKYRRSERQARPWLRLSLDVLLLCLLLLAGLACYAQHSLDQQRRADPRYQQAAIQARTQITLLADKQQAAQMRAEARSMLQKLRREAQDWGKAHLYHNAYNGHTYLFDSGYTRLGIASMIANDLSVASTPDDYAAVIAETKDELFNLHMLEADFTDHTPFNQIHQSDQKLLSHYGLQSATVLVVSSVEQVLRVYKQGKLIRAFWITGGQAERPSLPGKWTVQARYAPVVFEAKDPPGSPYWFPATLINYAIMYRSGGFFIHDAPWRATFGPGTQFPHNDASGNTAYNFNGSHGCINLSTADTAWLYRNTDWRTSIVIY